MTSVPTIARLRARGAKERRKAIFGLRGISVKTIRTMLPAVLLTIVFAASSLLSQRNFSTTYDSGRQVKLQGIVTRIDWVNPNAFFFINVKDNAGTISNWAVEFGNPLDLERDGWKRNTLHVNDVVTVEGVLARSDGRQAFAKS